MKIDAYTFVCKTIEREVANEDANEKKAVTKADSKTTDITGQENEEYTEFRAFDGVECRISDAIRSKLNKNLQNRPTERAIAIRTQKRRVVRDDQSK